MRRLLLVGGGHAHVEVIRRFGADREAGVSVVLASPDRFTPYSGMLPGWIAGHYAFADCHIDLAALCGDAGVTLHPGRVVRIDPEARVATLADGTTLPFDLVSIDTGSSPADVDVPGVAEHALPVKPVGAFMAALEGIETRVAAGAVRRIVAVGGGAAGIEVLLAVRHRITVRAGRGSVDWALVTDAAGLLPAHPRRVGRIFERLCERQGIAVHTAFAATRIGPEAVHAADGRLLLADVVLWATGAGAPAWPRASGLACDDRGFIAVDATLRSRSHPSVFAAGDVASLPRPVPKSGVYAVRAGPVLAANLRRSLRGEPLLQWTPQPAALALITTGGRAAVASRGDLVFGGGWAGPLVWRWKDRIDRRFMRRYRRIDRGGAGHGTNGARPE